MKTYRLVSWPDLPAEFQRTAFRRACTELSMRAASIERLMAASGLKRPELVALLEQLESEELLVEDGSDDVAATAPGWFDRLRRSATSSPWTR